MQYPYVQAYDEPAFAGPSSKMLALDPVWGLLELTSLLPALSLFRLLPRGDGHPVMTAPGFMAGDGSMAILRGLLKKAGYNPLPWGLGQNITINDAKTLEQTLVLRERMVDRLVLQMKKHHQETGERISLIGWSLGGVMSRDAACRAPEVVRQVITLGTPFGDPRSVSIYEILARRNKRHPTVDEVQKWIDRSTEPLEDVPLTAIYSNRDGFVSPGIAREQHCAMVDNVCLPSSHIGFAANPLALYVIADRLAQADGDWKPFSRTLLRRLWCK